MQTTLSSTFTLQPQGDFEIVMSRQFNAPRELVFKAHTSCEHLQHWLGPSSLELTFCDMDFRVGGSYRFVHRDSDGAEYAFRGDFLEIAPPERMTRTFEFEMFPGQIVQEVLILEETDGVTTLKVVAKHGSKESRDGMMSSGMEAGVSESWSRLEQYLGEMD